VADTVKFVGGRDDGTTDGTTKEADDEVPF
jgi:hypothetical protein